ncbi:methyl-accepting chemotaxis protein [Paenibacillus sp. SGZ-1009]|uniref:methyl-accepting chemotaxis protein n=1 Tax=Paenibacillus campi TaxID=3106031 RepID=UPI002AFE5077|nr:methyl-accepting chemotaxis protein [Paenibacillus sp. SGZ-1009]
MKLLNMNNWSLTIKMLVPVIVLMSALIILSILSVRNLNMMENQLVSSIYGNAYRIDYLVLNADRDYYQAMIAQMKLLSTSNEQEIQEQTTYYTENTKQVQDRMQTVKAIIIAQQHVLSDYKDPKSGKTLLELIDAFISNYTAWQQEFNINERKLNSNTNADAQFNAARADMAGIEAIVEQYTNNVLDDSTALKSRMYVLTLVQLISAAIISAVIIWFVMLNVRRRTKDTLDLIERTSRFDLVYVDKFTPYLSQNDEFATIFKALGEARKQFRLTFSEVIEKSANLQTKIQLVEYEMNTLSTAMHDISSTTEQLSAGMEETAASTQEMNATSNEMEAAVDSVASKAQQGAVAADQLTGRAAELALQFKASYADSEQTFKVASENLLQALEDSKSVEQIRLLVSSIIDIAAQTNLLSLNASIEAARAGDAGRGFAVVASEISKLAYDSKQAADRINEITGIVTSSVNNLSSHSNHLLQLFDTNIWKDYRMMLASAEHYATSAQEIDSIAGDLSTTSEQLLASVGDVVKTIHEISVAADQGAQGTGLIAAKTDDIVQQTNRVSEQLDLSKQDIEGLAQSVSKFKLS